VKSLWLHPSKTPQRVKLARFADYPHFMDTLTQHEGWEDLPKEVTVRWRKFGAFTKYLIEADDEEQAQEIDEWIDTVSEMIRSGQDVPPLVYWQREPFDGRHRAFAAKSLGLAVAPTITIEEVHSGELDLTRKALKRKS